MASVKEKYTEWGGDRSLFAKEVLMIKKRGGGGLLPFVWNVSQWYVERMKMEAIAKGRPPIFLVGKARKEGVTTMEQGNNFHIICTRPHSEAITLAQNDPDTEKIFRIACRMYEKWAYEPGKTRPRRKTVSKKEIDLPTLGSLFYIGTAGSRAFARGQDVSRLHGSEVAHWVNEDMDNFMAGVLEACPDGEIVLETTANGASGWFYETWMDSEDNPETSPYTRIFLPWFMDNRYSTPLLAPDEIAPTPEEEALIAVHGLSLEQIKWRRAKKALHPKKFAQEYPETPEGMFIATGNTWFDVEVVKLLVQYCKPGELQGDGSLIIYEHPQERARYCLGVDSCSGRGDDWATIFVLNVDTCEEAACLKAKLDPLELAIEANRLGRLYNDALVAPECAGEWGGKTTQALVDMNYPNLYYHVDERKIDPSMASEPGYPMNKRTRPLVLVDLRDAIQPQMGKGRGDLMVNSRHLLSECTTLRRKPRKDGSPSSERDRYEAQGRDHDDIIFAAGIAWQIREWALGNQIILLTEGGIETDDDFI